jgi:hypothetical protein
MPDKKVGWLVPTSLNADGTLPTNMQTFQTQLQNHYHAGNVTFPNPQFLNGDNTNLAGCVQALMAGSYDAFAIAGSSGVRALVVAQAGQVNKIPIIQVVGGDPVPANSTYITGYHIDAANVATAQVNKLKQKANPNNITVLLDYSSDTAARVFNAIVAAANSLTPPIPVTPLFARNTTELANLSSSSVRGSFMLAPSGMFYNSSNMTNYIIPLVEGAGVPAVYPEREFKQAHTPQYQNKVWVVGHKIPPTYAKAGKLAADLLLGTVDPGDEAPDKDVDP